MEQSNQAAERSAHVTRGNNTAPSEWPVIQMPDGTWKLKAVVALEARIAGLERDFTRAEEEMKIADRNRIHFQKELEQFMAIARDQSEHINELRSAIYRYVNHVVSCEGVSFTDVDITDADKPWAKLIDQVWDEVNKEEGWEE